MSFHLRLREGFLARAYARVGLPAPAGEAHGYLRCDRVWSEAARRRVERVTFEESAETAARFASEDEAWAAFDRSGYGQREDYEVIEL